MDGLPHTPTTPPVLATSLACSGEMRRGECRGLPLGHGRYETGSAASCWSCAAASTNSHGGVRYVDHDAQPIAFGDRVASERRQTTLVRGLGLVVAHVAAEEVHQLQVSHTAPVHFADTLQLALEEVATLDGLHDGRRPVPVRRFQISRAAARAAIPASVTRSSNHASRRCVWRQSSPGSGCRDGADAVVRLPLDHGSIARSAPGTPPSCARYECARPGRRLGLGPSAGARRVRMHVDAERCCRPAPQSRDRPPARPRRTAPRCRRPAVSRLAGQRDQAEPGRCSSSVAAATANHRLTCPRVMQASLGEYLAAPRHADEARDGLRASWSLS